MKIIFKFHKKSNTERFTDLDKLNLDKFAYGDLFLGSSQFSLLPKLAQKMKLSSKVTQK